MSALRGVGRLLLGLVVATVALELALDVRARFGTGPWRPGASRRVLCAGDSHVYGGGVPAEEAYPARLQGILDARAPGTWSVLNRGLPMFNTAQVRRRFEGWLDDWQPDTVVVTVGTNNVWNVTDEDDRPPDLHDRLRRRLRIVRLLDAWRAPPLDATTDALGIPFGDRPRFSGLRGHVVIDLGDGPEAVDIRARLQTVDAATVDRARRDYGAIARAGRARGVHVVFVTYETQNPLFEPFTAAMREVAARERCPIVDAQRSVGRVPAAERRWTYGLHPGPTSLVEIARDVAATLLALPPPAH